MSSARPLNVFIVAGEASADLLGAELLEDLRALNPQVQSFGVGGDKLRSAGTKTLFDSTDINLVGFSSFIKKLPAVYRCFRRLVKEAAVQRPDVAVLIDLPDFNLRLAKKLRGLGIPVVYYVSPQLWAWRKGRIEIVKKYVDKMLVLYPFEADFYEKAGVPVRYVGHPLVTSIAVRATLRTVAEIGKAPKIALLPGSRRSELEAHIPLFREFVRKISLSYPNAEFRLPVAPTMDQKLVNDWIAEPKVSVESRPAKEVVAWADAAIVSSGTATLETGLVGTPFVLVYRGTAFNAWMVQKVFRYRGFFGIPNILLGRMAFPELLQKEASPESLVSAVSKLLGEPAVREQQAKDFQLLRERFGLVSGHGVVAEEVLKVALAKPPFKKLGATLVTAPS